jgi:PAS domain S-box-containing protein
MDALMLASSKKILDYIPESSLFIDQDVSLVNLNEEAKNFFALHSNEQVNIQCLVTTYSLQQFKQKLMKSPARGKMEMTALNSKLGKIPVIFNYKLIEDGYIVTIQPHFTTRAAESSDYFNLARELSNEYAVLFMENDEATFISESIEEVLGYKDTEILSINPINLIHKDDLNRVQTRRKIVSGQKAERYNQVFRAKHKNGQFIWVEAKISRKYFNTNGSHKSLIFIKDITKRVQYEQALIEAKQTAENAVKSKNQFLSEVTHDIRTPMNTIIGISHLLLNKNPRKDQVDLINTIKVSGDNLLSLINDVLDFSKIQANKIEFESVDFDLLTLLKSLKIGFKIAAEAKGISFEIATKGKIPEVIKGDQVRLNQILNNLLSNAIKFTSSGRVKLMVTAEENNETSEITFRVSDTGIGIPQKKLEQIFEPYAQASKDTTRKYGGTGLGLTILKKLVELQGGVVDVKSQEGKGSEFIVKMNFAKADIAKKSDFIEPADLSEVNILYVEDVISNQLLMKGLCAMWGVNLDVAANAKRAMELMKEKTYDLLLLDLQLPDMNGIELVKKIRTFEQVYYKNISIIAVTGDTSTGLLKKLKLAGFNDLAHKPFNPEKLHGKISEQLGYQSETIEEKGQELSSANFATLDIIYANKKPDYLDLLRLLKIEYQKYFEALQYSIENNDLKGVRTIIHKMTPNLKTLGLVDFLTYLDQLKQEMRSKPGDFNDGMAKKQLQVIFNKLISLLDQKLSDLDEEK